ncbi:phage virion morphogenesis protein [Mucilaginibacter sp. L3T2-6]|uniref:phage virion morphogenesis protein n=1 Tax=Mucilaginibacter sp. L3T2-6 TaxID=3062491 RepID=UPI002675220B|nr:phage virion morphogenesis protein [Mucilaginibacter sp. L3T2-6]MDO3641964.1 phage virion morphogenesis protein [Mucilaginibacter sp. L3T2-6]MDV6214358.1 phage virion morphogenesis protein [Mucilaginibacter sp. L3T2-6]
MPLSNKDKIHRFFAALPVEIQTKVPPIIGETAVELFKENILSGSYDGVPWQPLSKSYLAAKKRNKDKILYLNGLLFASIRYNEPEAGKVIVSAGSSKVPYARIHNEGLTVNTIARVGAYTRNKYKVSKRGKRSKSGTVEVREHTRKMDYTMPRRQFMGYSYELRKRFIQRIKPLFKK